MKRVILKNRMTALSRVGGIDCSFSIGVMRFLHVFGVERIPTDQMAKLDHYFTSCLWGLCLTLENTLENALIERKSKSIEEAPSKVKQT